jgi:hypothetical protein
MQKNNDRTNKQQKNNTKKALQKIESLIDCKTRFARRNNT